MDTDSSYNGWTNYETWRVNLEIVDGMTVKDFIGHGVPAPSELKDAIKEYVESAICESAGGEGDSGRGIARDYALAFVSNVNYWEIAEALIADYADEGEE